MARQAGHDANHRYPRVAKRDFQRWIARCRKLYPLSKPVRAELAEPGDDCIGICWDAGTYYVLKVCPRLDRHHAADTTLHEWAHLSRGDEDPDALDLHDAAYWERFGEIYRAWHRVT